MPDINAELILNLMKEYKIDVPFSDEENKLLIKHFRDSNMNQFYLLVIQKILTVKSFTENSDKIITGLTAILADKVGKTSTDIKSDEEIITLVSTLYKILFLLDIKELYGNKF